jgi:hypothetical protein
MADLHLAAEVFGCLGLVGCCVWTFAATRARMIALQLLSGSCFALHWALQGHWTAALSCALMLALAVVSLALEGNAGGGRVRVARVLFLCLLPAVAAVAALTWQGPASAFAAVGTAVVCLARWQVRMERFRALLLLSSVPWLGHNLLVGSVPGVAADLFCLWRAASERRGTARGASPASPAVA